VELVLPYVPSADEPEIREAFEQAHEVRAHDERTRALADQWFFETVVRLHRGGEGAAYTGLKPAGLDRGPAIPLAERAIETGSADELVALLSDTIAREAKHRLETAMHRQSHEEKDVSAARSYVEAMLGFEVWAHKVYSAAIASHHEGDRAHAAHREE
jgi:hypothetical protein